MNGDETWKIEYFNEYEYETTTQDEVPPNFVHKLSCKSTQSAYWDSLFSLERLMTTNSYFNMDEFALGLRFELYYWIEDYAFCLNLAHFIEPVTFGFTTDQSVVQCEKTLISCFDDWSMWLDEEAKFMDCSQSSSS